LNEVIWFAEALTHLRAIRAYIEQFNPRAAAALAEQLIGADNRLVNFQLRGLRVPRTNMRELVTSKPSRAFVRRTIAQRSFAPPS
jgi:plasmid stabilization system protein ParE